MNRIVLALALATTLSVHAQDAAPPDGKWDVTWQAPNGQSRTGALELQGGNGTWRSVGVMRGADACITRPAPAKVEVHDGQPHLLVARSQVLAGCQDNLLKLTVEADGGMKSAWPDGRPIVFRKL
ncbi:hypothetical protein H8N03_01160 [Ramlibacter sp. USB13]|uniref:META domain-containing protein n=1 Tax=Ramlibacter cellulosilyticus TaxID=2764187 RepID=A0A923MMT4_9BURK|nr:hypothetical protein [Ramlibacter cellulosilyticus]MBC5781531.1 hypothetical protein [Ramlibacter cellulosilyticus]